MNLECKTEINTKPHLFIRGSTKTQLYMKFTEKRMSTPSFN